MRTYLGSAAQFPGDDRPNLISRSLGLRGLLIFVKAKLNQLCRNAVNASSGPEAAHPVFVVEGNVVIGVEGTHSLFKTAPEKNFGLDPLAFSPPHIIDIKY